MDRQDFAHTRVVIENLGLRVPGRIQISHSSFGTPYKRCITEDDPGLFGAVEECFPKQTQGRRRVVFRSLGGLVARYALANDLSYCQCKEQGEDRNRNRPTSRTRNQGSRKNRWFCFFGDGRGNRSGIPAM